MADTLQSIKKRLNIDQRNISAGTVTSVSNGVAQVRLTDGTTRKAYLPGSVNASTGDVVRVELYGNVVSIQGEAQLQPTGGEKTVLL